ncbi:hypothetical protein N9L22_03900 [Candidatus Poseidonia alphae]|nr:hypothetical protein [Candidatus Poseidonia alphae]
MKGTVRTMAFSIVLLFFISTMTGLTTDLNPLEQQQSLDEEPVVYSAATSPGHVVFAQYISSDNCPHCYKAGGGSAAHHKLKVDFPDEYVYVTYMSASYGSTNSARAGNVAPYSWQWPTGGAPDAYFGDRTDIRQSGASSNSDSYDDEFTAGGGMHTSTNDYGMTAAISANGGTFDIDISYKYTGSGSAASNMKLYAAIVEEECTTYTYSSSGSALPHGYNCWMGWLTSGDTYKTKSTGSGSAFASVSPTSSQQSLSWTSVPTSLIAGGTSNAVVVAALISGNQISVGGNSPHVYHAIDSTMGPKMDIGITDFSVANSMGDPTYMTGDIVTLSADVKNTGDLDYTDGGQVEFYYKNGVSTTVIDSASVPSLNVAQGSSYLSATANFDTSSLPSNAWKTTFGSRLVSLTGDMAASNNMQETQLDHDRPPLAKKAQVIDTNIVERGSHLTVLAKGSADDNIDTIDSMTFEIEVSPTGLSQWDASIVTGGDSIVYRDTPNEGRQYVISPTLDMPAGVYDIRSRTLDARGQTSAWAVSTGSDGFELANGEPTVVADPVPTVMCDIPTKVSMIGHISDPETPLSQLIVTSSSPNFVAWHAATQEVEVLFPYDNGCPLGQKGIEVVVDDGGDYSDTGITPYGTLLFNVIENGQPRWSGLPLQLIDEAGTGSLMLNQYVSDTDSNGATVNAAGLDIQVMSHTNPDAFVIELVETSTGVTLNFFTVDDDKTGETIVTLRASDGEQFSDQTITIRINPVNDAPRIDLTDIEDFQLKRGKQMVINLKTRMTDIDSPVEQAFITVTPSEPGAARYNILDGNMILNFDETGEQTVTIAATDGFATNVYTMTVDVFDAYPFTLSTEDDGSGLMFISLEDTYVGQTPTATMILTDSAPVFTTIDLTWNLCSDLTGTCEGLRETSLNVAKSNVGWSEELDIKSIFNENDLARPNGSKYMDYYKIEISGVSDSGDEYRSLDGGMKFTITENLPAPGDMSDKMLTDYVAELTSKIELLEASIDSEDGDVESMEAELAELNIAFELACEDNRTNCPTDDVKSANDSGESSLDTNLIIMVIGVLIVASLLGLMFIRGGRDEVIETKWNEASLPAHDAIANSMYGGAQEIFQQPVAAYVAPTAVPQPVAQPVVIPAPAPMAGPPLPPGGLPAGWTMEQWTYYGQQYLDQMNQY